MHRYCEVCRTVRPAEQFVTRSRCALCTRKATEKGIAIRVTLPAGWSSSDPGLPEMSLPTEEELVAGYEGRLWRAQKGSWTLEVLWRGDTAKFFCQVLRAPENEPRESRAFDYPHEVVAWLGVWFAQLVERSIRPIDTHETG